MASEPIDFDGRRLDRVVEAAFDTAFPRLRAGVPYVSGGLLVCPGGLVGTAASHRCRFVAVDGDWCFERADLLCDIVRWDEGRPGRLGKKTMRSVTVLRAAPGLLVESVTGRLGLDGHRMVEVAAWALGDGELVATGRRRARDEPRWPSQREVGV